MLAAAPICADWPAALTVCSGVTLKASHMAPTAMTRNVAM
jgi:hypothetical protein